MVEQVLDSAISRRNFLKGTAVAILGLTLTGCALSG
ncbi:MAG: hypothetical protein G01um10147_587 [Microgenomates group bacterium Gr01-1014_7]|nr:MAG: hypothetical protein G01um10147_587 [Microgenomates group bacterium Gr01-1014_7]